MICNDEDRWSRMEGKKKVEYHLHKGGGLEKVRRYKSAEWGGIHDEK